jgi:type VI secretion system secreted protein Hcp
MASDYLLMIDGIKGECMDSKHPNTIEILTFTWGAVNTGSAGFGVGAGAGKVQFQDVHFTSHTSLATPDLMLSCWNGKHIAKAQLFVRKQGGTQLDYYVVTLENLIVSKYVSGGSSVSSDRLPTDQFSLNFAKVHFEYTQQTADGGRGARPKCGWDLQRNSKL